MKVTISISLDSERDADLLRHYHGADRWNRSAAVRDAWRLGLGRGGVTNADLMAAIRQLANDGVRLVREESGRELGDEPEDVAANIDKWLES